MAPVIPVGKTTLAHGTLPRPGPPVVSISHSTKNNPSGSLAFYHHRNEADVIPHIDTLPRHSISQNLCTSVRGDKPAPFYPGTQGAMAAIY